MKRVVVEIQGIPFRLSDDNLSIEVKEGRLLVKKHYTGSTFDNTELLAAFNKEHWRRAMCGDFIQTTSSEGL